MKSTNSLRVDAMMVLSAVIELKSASYQGNNNQTEAQLLKQSRYTKIGVPSKVENSLTLTGQGSAVEDAERDVVALHTT